MSLGIDAVRDAYLLLTNLGVLTSRQGYGAEVRQPSGDRTVVPITGESVIETRMPTLDEVDDWGLDVGVSMLVIDGKAYPGDRFIAKVTPAHPEG